jgi:hypothetical protein
MRLYLLLMLILVGCGTNKVKPDFEVDFSGKWAWSTDSDPCTKNWHRIHIDESQKVIIFEDANVFEQYTGETTRFYKYQILGKIENGYHVLLEAEKRTNKNGNIVSWYLLQSDSTTYKWRRSDWSPESRTESIFKCDN